MIAFLVFYVSLGVLRFLATPDVPAWPLRWATEEQAMARFKKAQTFDGRHYGITFKCPGCRMSHMLPTKDGVDPEGGWTWNLDLDLPVLSPSILARGAMNFDEPDEAKDWMPDAICHSFVGCNGAQPGEITFLSDCTHALAGQTVPLSEIED